MKGGELINQGSYGCIYKPGLKCNVEKEGKKEGELTKLQILNEFSIKEMEIGKKIMESYPKDYMEQIIESLDEASRNNHNIVKFVKKNNLSIDYDSLVLKKIKF